MFAAQKFVAALVAVLGLSCGGSNVMDEADGAQAGQGMAVSKNVYGTFVTEAPSAGQFIRMVLLTDGRFHAEQAVVCFTEPCDPVVIEGTFQLHKFEGMDCVQLHNNAGEYLEDLPYVYSNSVLSISPTMEAPKQDMNRGPAWCAQADDCKHQNLYCPAAEGSWKCESNTCKFEIQSEGNVS